MALISPDKNNSTIKPGEVYEGYLIAEGNNVLTSDSPPAQFKVTIPPIGSNLTTAGVILDAIKLATPMNFAGVIRTATSARFTWTNVNGNNGYEITLTRVGFEQTITLTTDPDAVTIDADNLITGEVYNASIKTLGSGRFSESDPSADISVDLNLDELPPPSNYRVVGATTTTAPLQWNLVANAARYSLRWRQVAAADEEESDFAAAVTVAQPSSGTTVSHTVPGLTSNTEYEFEITTIGEVPYASSPPVSITAFTAGAVSDLPLPSIEVESFSSRLVALTMTGTATTNVRFVVNRENTVTERIWVPGGESVFHNGIQSQV